MRDDRAFYLGEVNLSNSEMKTRTFCCFSFLPGVTLPVLPASLPACLPPPSPPWLPSFLLLPWLWRRLNIHERHNTPKDVPAGMFAFAPTAEFSYRTGRLVGYTVTLRHSNSPLPTLLTSQHRGIA